jgi:hypothetical protein
VEDYAALVAQAGDMAEFLTGEWPGDEAAE